MGCSTVVWRLVVCSQPVHCAVAPANQRERCGASNAVCAAGSCAFCAAGSCAVGESAGLLEPVCAAWCLSVFSGCCDRLIECSCFKFPLMLLFCCCDLPKCNVWDQRCANKEEGRTTV